MEILAQHLTLPQLYTVIILLHPFNSEKVNLLSHMYDTKHFICQAQIY